MMEVYSMIATLADANGQVLYQLGYDGTAADMLDQILAWLKVELVDTSSIAQIHIEPAQD